MKFAPIYHQGRNIKVYFQNYCVSTLNFRRAASLFENSTALISQHFPSDKFKNRLRQILDA